MEENKSNPLINDAFLWGVNISVNDKVYNNNDIFVKEKLNKNCNNYDDILANIELIKNSSDDFLQKIIEKNPTLKTFKEKKENIEFEE